MRLGIHVLTYNRPTELAVMLTTLAKQTHDEWDLILVDSSNQKVISIPMIAKLLANLKLEGHGVDYVPLDYRPSIGEARNIAIERDDNEVCVRIDDDSYLDSEYLERLKGAYNFASREKVGAIGGTVPLFGAAPTVGFAGKFDKKPFNEITFHPDQVFKGVNPANGKPVEVQGLISVADDGGIEYDNKEWKLWPSHHLRSSFLFNKKAVIEAGLHPKEYGYTGFREETDLCMRLVMKGYKLFTDPSAKAYHVQAETGGARINDYQGQIALCEMSFQRKFLRAFRNGDVKKGMFTIKGE